VEKDNIARERRGREAGRPGKLETREVKLERESSIHPGIYTIHDQNTAHGRGARAGQRGQRGREVESRKPHLPQTLRTGPAEILARGSRNGSEGPKKAIPTVATPRRKRHVASRKFVSAISGRRSNSRGFQRWSVLNDLGLDRIERCVTRVKSESSDARTWTPTTTTTTISVDGGSDAGPSSLSVSHPKFAVA
jgi:hypothetical protein